MLKHVVVATLVASCSSNPPTRKDVEVTAVPAQRVATFRAHAAPVREPVAAWSLTASDGTGLALVAVEAKAVIEGPLAFTELHLRFANPENRVREGTFAITLPSRAAISRFAMEEGGRLKEAEVVPKALARRAYDDFLHRRIDPALLEKAPGNQFTARVFPIAPHSEKHLVLSYSQELTNEGYVLPLRGLPRVERVDVSLAARDASGAWQRQALAERAWQPDRDFVATVASTTAIADGALVAGVFEVVPTFTEVATSEAAADRPSALTLLVDTSGSRSLGFARYVDHVRALVGALAEHYPGVTVDVVAFDQATQPIYRGPAARFGDGEVAALVARGPGGASDLARAASAAGGRTVIVTDGVVTAGREGSELAAALARADRVDVVLAGGIREERVAQTLARAGKRAGDVFDLDREAAAAIAGGLGARVRVDIPVEVANATWFHPTSIPSARDGTQVMVFARLAQPARTLDVTIGRQRWRATAAPATPALLARAAARVEIDALETTLAATTAPARQAQLRDAIARKSVESRVVSSETTLLVLDTEEDYVRYGIDRRALADILVVGPAGLTQAKRTFVASRTPRPDDGRDGGRDDTDDTGGARMRLEGGAAGRSDGDRSVQSVDIPRGRRQTIDAARTAGVLGTEAEAGGYGARVGAADVSVGFTSPGLAQGFGAGRGSFGATGGAAGPGNLHGTSIGQGTTSGQGRLRSRVAVAPAVMIAQPVVQGSLDRNIIKRYIKRRINQISYCYERELLARPTLEGTLQTRFLIGPGGKVEAATAVGVDETVARCVADVLKTIEFPTVTGGHVQVNYPFTFRIANRDGAAPAPDAPAPARAAPAAPAPDVPASAADSSAPPAPARPDVFGARPVNALRGKLAIVMTAIANHDVERALAVATAWRDEQPGDVLAWVGLGEALEARGERAAAARAYGSIIDLFGARAEYRRFAGERLERTGERWLAVDTYRRAVADRPDQLTGHRLLAYALLRDGDHAGAFAAILAGTEQNIAADRYAGAPQILARDAGMIGAAYAAAHPDRRDWVLATLAKRSLSLVTTPSTRFLLYWETDTNDVDLHVLDARGSHAFYGQRTLPSGGELYADVMTGFGPECFEIVGKPRAAPYELAVHYYAQGPMGYGMGLLQIERFDGRAFTFEDRPFVIMRDQAKIALGIVR